MSWGKQRQALDESRTELKDIVEDLYLCASLLLRAKKDPMSKRLAEIALELEAMRRELR